MYAWKWQTSPPGHRQRGAPAAKKRNVRGQVGYWPSLRMVLKSAGAKARALREWLPKRGE